MTPLQRPPHGDPAHHPGLDVLAKYAAGQLRAGFDVVVAAHLRQCRRCRGEVAGLETIGGGLLDTIAPVSLGARALADVMRRIDEVPVAPEPPAPPARSLDQLLAGARRRWIAPGIWIANVDTPHAADDRVFLLRVAPGKATALHSHAGPELTQVLTGALLDGGAVYRAGDMIVQGEEHAHRQEVAGDEPCICLLATQGRLKAQSPLGRIAFALAGV